MEMIDYEHQLILEEDAAVRISERSERLINVAREIQGKGPVTRWP